ncbi:DUF1206 domain-containing protein [Tellurirhabdus rosea]|uniref:DUF1206 domain-containing protein n=1 Tax=Tellurirhabdus rosea TaxID=2674997 RepID=UPI002258BA96|nr:DUF1206 domain-containing protein [Tellurirhabdus rosea]
MLASSKETIEKSKRVVELLARWSYVIKGLLFLFVSVLAWNFALQLGGPHPNRRQVLESWNDTLTGRFLLGFTALFLTGHLLWRLLEAWNDPYEKGRSPGGLIYRLTYLISAISYGALAWTALQLLLHREAGPEHSKKIWIADQIETPGGRWLVGGIGAIMLLWGLVQGYKGLTGAVVKAMDEGQLPPLGKAVGTVCSFGGFLALSVLLSVSGISLIQAAVTRHSEQVKGMNDVIQAISYLPFGHLLVMAEAAGLALFGLFMLLMARYFPFRAA